MSGNSPPTDENNKIYRINPNPVHPVYPVKKLSAKEKCTWLI
jgi:hypothetical protein